MTSEAWCGTPPHSVSLGAAPADWEEEEEEEEEALAAVVRARFGAITRECRRGVAPSYRSWNFVWYTAPTGCISYNK